MAINYPVQLLITLTPIWHQTLPEVQIKVDDILIKHTSFDKTSQFKFDDNLLEGKHFLTVEFLNKTDSDSVDGLDKAINIDSIEIMGISSQQFVYAGIYYPRYPEPWATQQREQGIDLESRLYYKQYLGWNGVWRLEFTAPVFTWIHHVENLGWIYD